MDFPGKFSGVFIQDATVIKLSDATASFRAGPIDAKNQRRQA